MRRPRRLRHLRTLLRRARAPLRFGLRATVAAVLAWLAADLAGLLADANAYFYVCGLKSMEEGVVLALRDVARQAGLEWETVAASLKREGRLHLETY